mmetsp:Transcript_39199/g.92893  ORF Transcript_39199/g.92893 Transcript_39199/m.92893 type:complete len:628 (-) Transcript_39199:95-1978(-)
MTSYLPTVACARKQLQLFHFSAAVPLQQSGLPVKNLLVGKLRPKNSKLRLEIVRGLNLICGATVTARTGSSKQKRSRRDYVGNATDKIIFRMHPNTGLSDEEISDAFGYPRNLTERYHTEEEIGAGNFGTVYRVIDTTTGEPYACKSIPKVPKKQTHTNPHHLLKIRNEVDCMYRLGASFDAVFLRDVFEDDKCVHLVMELCEGGTLMDANSVHMTEQTVAQVMRSVLRFLALCHSRGVIYRDVKPDNFLFTTKDFDRILKATDFGLAIPHAPGSPPLTTPAGTPIYLAPEVIEKSYDEQADLFSAGVMAFQLLTGRYPYWPDLKFKPPTMKELFELIRTHEIDFRQLRNEGISSLAQDFLEGLLHRDPSRRMTADEALHHPWLWEEDEDSVIPFNGSFVQRLQHFAVHGHLKQYVLTLITDSIICGQGDILTHDQTLQILAPLKDLFSQMDNDASGDVSCAELEGELTREGYSLTEAELQQLICRIDKDHDGRILFSEFASSLIDWSVVQETGHWEELVRDAFEKLDSDADGAIGLGEIMAALPESYCAEDERAELARSMIREFDNDCDGSISWEEFLDMLSHGDTPEMLEFYDKRLSGSSGSRSSDSSSLDIDAESDRHSELVAN